MIIFIKTYLNNIYIIIALLSGFFGFYRLII